jgi:3-methyladenine DNA glycosylase AlkC
MPEPFKNFFNPEMIKLMADHLHSSDQSFERARFVRKATRGLGPLELKERSNHILGALEVCLPEDFRRACDLMLAALHPDYDKTLSDNEMDAGGIRNWAVMPMADYVARHGLDDFDFSMDVLKEMTKRFSSEFAIRAFILTDTKKALRHALRWTGDPCQHVRRLASEGTRPRLPWGTQLTMLVDDPSPALPILEALKGDPEEYVRRSVANHLNDIAKDHPDVVADIARRWLVEASGDRKRLVRHACRTLIKQGHRRTLKALGYGTAKVSMGPIDLKTPVVRLGGSLEFGISLSSDSRKSQPLIVDFIIHHLKANGSTAPKVFKWKTLDLAPEGDLAIDKRHPIRKITTRVYYAGEHELEIQINGQSFGRIAFELEI